MSNRDPMPPRQKTHTSSVFQNYIPVPESGCWLWVGGWDGRGYGKTGGRCGSTGAHRLFFEKFNGPLVEGGVICHKCDTPACVNPCHLYQGTQKDNAEDRERRGRGRWRKK
ncbi:TPA: HNH endonuclease [Stenotrophomonas maltophilia]|nr:HNH endonuclease [Stenotrophomonas maltophilia]